MAAAPSAGQPQVQRPRRNVRFLAAGAALALAGTYLAAQIDLVRRHQPGIAPSRYWVPQVVRIWLPGLGLTVALALAAFVLHRRSRPK